MFRYPAGTTVFKEMLQNADDAAATEVKLLVDFRTHDSGGIFNDDWKKMQGPALVIYNNKGFSEADLEGNRSAPALHSQTHENVYKFQE